MSDRQPWFSHDFETCVQNRKLVSNIEHFCPKSDKKVWNQTRIFKIGWLCLKSDTSVQNRTQVSKIGHWSWKSVINI